MTISPFSGRLDICPQDKGRVDLYVKLAKQDMMVSCLFINLKRLNSTFTVMFILMCLFCAYILAYVKFWHFVFCKWRLNLFLNTRKGKHRIKKKV